MTVCPQSVTYYAGDWPDAPVVGVMRCTLEEGHGYMHSGIHPDGSPAQWCNFSVMSTKEKLEVLGVEDRG